jgi:cellulose biosynthesis protein BcsQ
MATIAIYSGKGGVGKTTFAANLGWCASSISRRNTLVWDLDPANGSGFLFGVEPTAKKRAASIFSRDRDPSKLIHPTEFDNLDVLPADESIREVDRDFAAIGKKKRLAKIATKLGKQYDRIILDCPPVLNETSKQVVRAADLVIVPVPPSPLSRRALELVVREVEGSGKRHPPILPVLSMLDMRRRLHREVREANANWPAIPLAAAVEKGAIYQKPVGALDPKSPAARAFAQLWTAIERKLAKL